MRISYSSVVLFILFIAMSSISYAQKNYNTYAKRGQATSSPWTLGANVGVFFPEVFGVKHQIYDQKDYNPAFGISIGKQIISNLGLKADLSTGKISANNFNKPPALTDANPAYYRNYVTNVSYSANLNMVVSVPILRTGTYRSRPLSINVWGGAGIIGFETQFYVNPDQNVYYGKVTDVYTNFGGGLKYRVGKRVDLGANYVVHIFNGYNLDAVQVHGPNKDRYSFAYISLNVLLGEMNDWRYGRSRSCYTF